MIRVTDTHSLVWYLSGDARLSAPVKSALADPAAQIIIPTIVLAEVAFLHARGRIFVDVEAILRHVDRVTNCTLYSLDRTVALITRNRDITAAGWCP